jgi:glutaconate CoA-transferase subunit B
VVVMMGPATATPFERFILSGAREYRDGEVCFVGFHWPQLAARIARFLHAPDMIVVYETGVVEDGPTPELPTSPTDLRCAVGAPMLAGSIDALFGWLASGRVQRTFLDAPIVDRRGNVNTTAIGPYASPKVRLAGSGGGTELASVGRGLTLLCSSTRPRSFPERVDYLTSPGHLGAPGERARLGYPPDSGPKALITPLGRFTFGDGGFGDGGFGVDALQPGVGWDEVAATFVGWVGPEEPAGVERVPEPTPAELEVVRRVLAEAEGKHYRIPTGERG